MWKKKKKSLGKRLGRKVNPFNLSIIFVSIFISFCTVSFCNALQDDRRLAGNDENLSAYAARMADAFELYNQKRFQK